jgi:steroid delta-isomerase-like uncharacterized protein
LKHSDSATTDSTRAAVERYLTALNEGNVDVIVDCVTEDFFNEHTSSLGESCRGRDAYRARLPRFLSQFRDLNYEIEDIVVQDERAAVPYRMSCTWLDQSGSSLAVGIRGMFYFRVVGGRIAHRIDYWDSAEFRRQVETSVASSTLGPEG